MSYEEETVFINQFGVPFRKCEIKECIWNADCNEVSAGGIMKGKIKRPSFKGKVCNCSPENSIAVLEAARVRCYPEKDEINLGRIKSTGR
ncbi:MAG: hypothetical protein H7645_03145 [Candidatus Heimdallarchaeota archaeon]|nr:hypothetical protein [Candidatus Heimdallarchaeota archaeon]MCK4769312.1 hypothetical protein [Candidatus Heimdallarchaeota archaeon]